MPSMVLGNPALSGAILIVSGNFWSGQGAFHPVGGIQLVWLSSGGNCYVALSGNPPLSGGFMTINSGQMTLSGGVASGLLDGIPITPGGGYFIPKIAFQTSGLCNVFAIHDPAASGVGRLSWEVY